MTEPIAICRDPTELQMALRARADTMQFSRGQLDEITGLADGHSNKLLTDPPAKRLGPISLFLMVRGLGLSIALIEDPAMMEKLRRRPIRIAFNVRNGASHWRNASPSSMLQRLLQKNGIKGGKRRAETLTPERRTAIARRAARARWRQSRQAQKLEGGEHEQLV